MARRVEQIEDNPVALEGHDAGGHGNAALLLDLHPVRPRPPVVATRLDLAGQVDSAALQQQLLGQRRLTRIGVRDNRECTAGFGCGHVSSFLQIVILNLFQDPSIGWMQVLWGVMDAETSSA